MSSALTPAGPVTLITLDQDSVVTESDVVFEALIGPATHEDPLDTKSVRLADLLAPTSADPVLRWCRTGHDEGLVSGIELRGRRRDGLPLLLRAYGVGGAFAGSPAAVIDVQRPHRRLLLQRAGGIVAWTGGAPPPFPPRTGPDHVLAHDVRGQVRTARTFLGLHQRRLTQGVHELEQGHVPVPEAIATDQALSTSVRALGTADALIDALVRFERIGTDPLVVAPVRLIDVVIAAAGQALTIGDALSELDGHHDLAGGSDVRWEGPDDVVVVADAELLTWVIAELLVNARKFGRSVDDPPADPAVTVSARRRRPWIDVAVASRGRAIDPGLAPEAFSLGRQLQPQGDRPGSGLGLALCERIVARHAGQIGFRVDLAAPPPPDPSSEPGDEVNVDGEAGRVARARGTTYVELTLLAERE